MKRGAKKRRAAKEAAELKLTAARRRAHDAHRAGDADRLARARDDVERFAQLVILIDDTGERHLRSCVRYSGYPGTEGDCSCGAA